MKIKQYTALLISFLLMMLAPTGRAWLGMYQNEWVMGISIPQFLFGFCALATAWFLRKLTEKPKTSEQEKYIRISVSLYAASFVVSMIMFSIYKLGTHSINLADMPFKDIFAAIALVSTIIWSAMVYIRLEKTELENDPDPLSSHEARYG